MFAEENGRTFAIIQTELDQTVSSGVVIEDEILKLSDELYNLYNQGRGHTWNWYRIMGTFLDSKIYM